MSDQELIMELRNRRLYTDPSNNMQILRKHVDPRGVVFLYKYNVQTRVSLGILIEGDAWFYHQSYSAPVDFNVLPPSIHNTVREFITLLRVTDALTKYPYSTRREDVPVQGAGGGLICAGGHFRTLCADTRIRQGEKALTL